MKRKLVFFIVVLSVSLLIVELSLRCLGIREQLTSEFHINISPHSMFQPDSTTGWSLLSGEYNYAINKDTIQNEVTINKLGDRIFSRDSSSIFEKKATIHLYGCSNTFGYSLNDDQTQSYYLQNLLVDYEVQNKGVPAFGLTQMYLHLVDNVNNNERPNIAVFNYANFHDIRTPEHKGWSKLLQSSLAINNNELFKNYSYPYFVKQEDNSLRLQQFNFNQLSESFLTKNFTIFFLLNKFITDFLDERKMKSLNETAILTAQLIMEYCEKQHILAVFAFQRNSVDVRPNYALIDTLKKDSYNTLIYSIDYSDNNYNNCPFDCAHPNEVAQLIFANELYSYLDTNHILTK